MLCFKIQITEYRGRRGNWLQALSHISISLLHQPVEQATIVLSMHRLV